MNKVATQYKILNESDTDGVILVWPEKHMSSEFSIELEVNYAHIINLLIHHEIKTYIVVSENNDSSVLTSIRKKNNSNILKILNYECDDIWIRDYGPLISTTHIPDQKVGLTFEYNAYGEKYNYNNDKEFPKILKNYFTPKRTYYDEKRLSSRIVFEFGNLTYNNDICITNINSIREHNEGRDAVNQIKILFEDNIDQRLYFIDSPGITGDDTNGHIDNLVRLDGKKILYMGTDYDKHPDFKLLKNLERQLLQLRSNLKDDYEFIKINHGANTIMNNSKDDVLPFSYLNYLKVKDIIMLPVPDEIKSKEKNIFSNIFNGKKIEFINSRPFIVEYGGIHCATLNWYKHE